MEPARHIGKFNPVGVPDDLPGTKCTRLCRDQRFRGNLISGSNDSRFDDVNSDWAKVLRFDHSVNIPVDPQKGELQGVRQHQPFRFVKPFDTATPFLADIITNGETLTEVKFHWYDGDGTEFFTHTLKSAKISNLESGNSDIRTFGSMPREEISMLYEEITWLITDGNIEYTDAWKEE